MNNNGKYEDIINLPHHVSKKHSQMSLEARAAQFAPYAALTGYEEEIKETGRLTSKRKEIDEELKTILDTKLRILQQKITEKPKITVTYFIPDLKKNGGKYVTVTDIVNRINKYKQVIILENGTEIPIKEIIDIEYANFLWLFLLVYIY